MAEKTVDRKEALKAETPAQLARAIGVDPKRLRSKLRSMGVRVSENRGGFDTAKKKELISFFLDGKTEEKTSPAKETAKKN